MNGEMPDVRGSIAPERRRCVPYGDYEIAVSNHKASSRVVARDFVVASGAVEFETARLRRQAAKIVHRIGEVLFVFETIERNRRGQRKSQFKRFFRGEAFSNDSRISDRAARSIIGSAVFSRWFRRLSTSRITSRLKGGGGRKRRAAVMAATTRAIGASVRLRTLRPIPAR